jgi:hypothetical protein
MHTRFPELGLSPKGRSVCDAGSITRNVTITAGNGRYEHDIWGAKGSLNGNPQAI